MFRSLPKALWVSVVLVGVTGPVAMAQERREPPGGALPDYAKLPPTQGPYGTDDLLIVDDSELPNIVLTGYWPPTNEMLRRFSTNPVQNPEGWIGGDWEGRGYDVFAFFPEFPQGLGKGEGDFEVDYQDTSADWWSIIPDLAPIAIITFGRADYDYDWELEGGHTMYRLDEWTNDYLAPLKPTPELPIADELPGSFRDSTLPLQAIVDAVDAAVPGVYPYWTTGDDSDFLCNFIGYHVTWYHDLHSDPEDPAWNIAAGHIHVGYHMTLQSAVAATEVTVRTLIEYLDAQLAPPAARPMPDGTFHIDGSTRACTSDADCLAGLPSGSQTYCVLPPSGDPGAGLCYVQRNRYLSIDPNPQNDGTATAVRVSLDLGGGGTVVLGWLGAPIETAVTGSETNPQLLCRLAEEPSRHYRDWSMDDAGQPWAHATIHLGDCEVSPGYTYLIQAIADGADLADEAKYSEPLVLRTTLAFGDVVGATAGMPPDGDRSFKDISAVVRGFQSVQTEPKVWLDLQGTTQAPEIPDFSDISFVDINRAVKGFQGGDYPFVAPCACPNQSCP